jgi:hypothetical protein
MVHNTPLLDNDLILTNSPMGWYFSWHCSKDLFFIRTNLQGQDLVYHEKRKLQA